MKTYTNGLIFFVLLQVSNVSFSQEMASGTLNKSDTLVQGKVLQKLTADTVFLINGDKITGKIISFKQGRLNIDSQASGLISIKWNKIFTIQGGDRFFKVEQLNGQIYVGHIKATRSGEIQVTDHFVTEINLEEIAYIISLENKWYKGIKGDLGAGVSYTKSSDVLRINAEYGLYLNISDWRISNSFSFIQTSINKGDQSVRIITDLSFFYELPHKWILAEINSFARNDELGITARYSVTAAVGNSLVQSDRQRFLFLSGIQQNAERNIDANQVSSNTEWPIYVEHTIYSFIKPNLSSTTTVNSFVGITEKSRYRLDANVDITWEFVKDFKVKLSFYYNYDNKVIEGKNSQNDFGTVFSLLLSLK